LRVGFRQDPKMPAHYIAEADLERLGMSGVDKIVAFDRNQSPDQLMSLSDANGSGTSGRAKQQLCVAIFG
jgi:hypothetical protein